MLLKTDPFNILSEQKLFYQDLYTSKDINVDSTQTAKSFLSNLDIPRLTEEQKLSCEGKITPEECAAVLENFQNNKSPGNDGIAVEFYKKFWSLLSESFVNASMNVLKQGRCHTLKNRRL